jgi:hypothetical protein
VVDTAATKPGVKEVPGPTTSRHAGIQVQTFAREANVMYQDQLVMMGHDLWSHWEIQLLQFQANHAEHKDGLTQRVVIVSREKVSEHMKNKGFAEVLRNASVPAFHGEGGIPTLVLDGMWLLTGHLDDYVQASYLVMRPDLDGRWYGFFTFGTGSPNVWWGGLAGVNGICEDKVYPSLYKASADWNASALISASNPLPSGCMLISEEDVKPVEGVYQYGSRAFRAEERAKLLNKCPIYLNRTENYTRTTVGCNGASTLFKLNHWGGGCHGNQLYTHPVSESKVHVGALRVTYRDAWNVYTALSKVSTDDIKLMYVDDPDRDATGHYVIVDASLQFDVTDLKEQMNAALLKAEAFMLNLKYESESRSAIMVAFTTLFIATVTIPQHWNEAIQKQVYNILAMVPAISNKKAARVAYVGLCRLLASSIVVGPAVFSFLNVVARDTGVRIADGYPTISYESATHPPYMRSSKDWGQWFWHC